MEYLINNKFVILSVFFIVLFIYYIFKYLQREKRNKLLKIIYDILFLIKKNYPEIILEEFISNILDYLDNKFIGNRFSHQKIKSIVTILLLKIQEENDKKY